VGQWNCRRDSLALAYLAGCAGVYGLPAAGQPSAAVLALPLSPPIRICFTCNTALTERCLCARWFWAAVFLVERGAPNLDANQSGLSVCFGGFAFALVAAVIHPVMTVWVTGISVAG